MAQENIEVIITAFRFFDRADWASYGEYWTEDAVLWPPNGWPEPGPFTGRAEIVSEWRRVREDWSVSRVSVEDHSGQGDRLVVRFRWVAEGAGSHMPVTMEISGACRFEDGRIADLRFFWEHAEALEAAGLRK